LSQNVGKKLPYSPHNKLEEHSSQIVLPIQVYAKGNLLTGNLLQVFFFFFLSLGIEDFIFKKWFYSWHCVFCFFCHLKSYFFFLVL